MFYSFSVKNLHFLSQVCHFAKNVFKAKNVRSSLTSLMWIMIPFFVLFQMARARGIIIAHKGPLERGYFEDWPSSRHFVLKCQFKSLLQVFNPYTQCFVRPKNNNLYIYNNLILKYFFLNFKPLYVQQIIFKMMFVNNQSKLGILESCTTTVQLYSTE